MFTPSGKTIFDKSLEKATSQQLLEPDWDSILAVCDSIRQGDVKAKYAIDAIKKKVAHENPNIGKYGLQVLESVVKNCGPPVHQEISSKESMEFLKDLAKAPKTPDLIKAKILELIQAWSHAFRNDSSYKLVQDTYNHMKLEGCSFPEFKESDAMFAAELAPEWRDGDNCYSCRATFTTFNRKHHCRRCGQIFCGKCSAFNSTIPALGIEKEVRVCEQCYGKLRKLPEAAGKEEGLPAAYLASPLSKQSQLPPKKKEDELREEEELQLAIAISQSEAEAKESEKKKYTASWGSFNAAPSKDERGDERSSEVIVTRAPKFEIDDGVSPELARYLNRDYWEKKQQTALVKTGVAGASSHIPGQAATQPSAPEATYAEPRYAVAGGGSAEVHGSDAAAAAAPIQNGVVRNDSMIDEEFLQVLSSSVDVFVNRMRSDSQRGRSIATDSSVQTLFEALQSMHPRLLAYMHNQEDRRAYHESLQDKLSQLKDARDALVALRDEHAERRRREAEERERQRQVQMAYKLDAMRKKKHEYLAQQRRLALEKMQEQERELQARLEQQKQLALMRQMQLHGFPQELQPGYVNYQPVQSSAGMYYSGPGGVLYQQHGAPDLASLQYQQQHSLLAAGQMVPTSEQGPVSWQQQPQGYTGSQAVVQSSETAYRMQDLAASLPQTTTMPSYPGPVATHSAGGATAFQQMPLDHNTGAAYQSVPASSGLGQQHGPPAAYQGSYYSAVPQQQQLLSSYSAQQLPAQNFQQQHQQPPSYQQQVPGSYQQHPYQPQQAPPAQGYQPQAQQMPPAQAYQPQAQQVPPAQGYQPQAQQVPPAQGYQPQAQQVPPAQGYQQPQPATQQYDNQLIIFD